MAGLPTIACVLRSGGVYTLDWVLRLRAMAQRHAQRHRFLCLTDLPHTDFLGTDILDFRLRHGWPGWWSKVELFRPGLFSEGPVLYLDLDSLVIGPLDDFFRYTGYFAALSDFYRPQQLGSGVMLWTPSVLSSAIYDRFVVDPDDTMRVHKIGGDQAWLERVGRTLPGGPPVDRLQKLFPGRFVSFKSDCRDRRDPPPAPASILCFHGRPKNNDFAPDHWVTRTWRAEAASDHG